MSKNLDKDLKKSADKNINKNEYYIRYAFENFTKEMHMIKMSINNQMVEELIKKYPEESRSSLEGKAMKTINEKLSIMVKVEFE